MAEYAGSAAIVVWSYGAGSLVMSGETRNVSVSAAQSVIDGTAGSDTVRVSIASFADWTVAWSGVAQGTATAATSGSAYGTALLPGKIGTLIVQPNGTASGNVIYTIPALVSASSIKSVYSDVTTIDAEWKSNAAITYATNA